MIDPDALCGALRVTRKGLAEAFFAQPAAADVVAAVDAVRTKHPGATAAQVAINWCRGHGAVPIPGCRTRAQAESNYAALDWSCSADDLARLDAAAVGLAPPAKAGFPERDRDTGLRMFDS